MTEPTQTYAHGKFGWVRWLVAAFVVANVVLWVVDYVLPGPSGDPSSALATQPLGFAAWAELADRNGIEVIVVREEIEDAELPPGSTVVALGARRSDSALDRHDGRVIEQVDDVRRLQNAQLAEGDNAAYALKLAGNGPLVFVEGKQARGLAALPAAGKAALLLLGVAALTLMLSRGRRFGPPDPPGRELAPPRVAYVDALAAALAKTRDPAGAMEPITRVLDAEPPKNDEAALTLARRYAESVR